jgi:tetratricopeptide (TPR) repeat protein
MQAVLRRGLVCLWVLFGAASVLAQPVTPQQQLELLTRANRAFEQALDGADQQRAWEHVQQAIAAYEQLVAAGIHNAKLYYNLGNAYFHLNDLGQAIVYYRRGLRLEPDNPRLQANLQYARSRRVDQIDTSPQQHLWRSILFWHDNLSLGTQTFLAVLGYVLIWGWAGIRLLWRRVPLAWGLSGAALLCLLFTASAVALHYANATTQAGVIVVEEAVVRKGNGESYALQLPQPLHRGTEFDVLEERGVWLHIQLANGTTGWIRREHAGLV